MEHHTKRLLDATFDRVAGIDSMTKLPWFSEVQRLRKNKLSVFTSSHFLGVITNISLATWDYKTL